MIRLLAACSSSLTSSRTISMISDGPSTPVSSCRTSSRTMVCLAPRIKSTTSSTRQPTTSCNFPSLSWPTASTLSPALRLPSLSAGPPGTTLAMLVYSFSRPSKAPIPSSDKRIEISKFSELRGDMYAVCGSMDCAKAFMKNWKISSEFSSEIRRSRFS